MMVEDGTTDMKVAIAIATCAKYSFILDPLFSLMERYWPDRSVPIYLSCDADLSRYRHVRGIKLIEESEDPGVLDVWVNLLKSIPHEYVLVMQEDFIIENPVDNDLLLEIFRDLQRDRSIACVRLMPFPPGEGSRITLSKVPYTELTPEQDYSFSFQLTVWDRSVFIQFMESRIKKGRTKAKQLGWAKMDYRRPKPKPEVFQYFNPEFYGFELFEQFPDKKFLCIYSDHAMPESAQHAPIPYRPTAIEDGKVRRWAQDFLKREQVSIEIPKGMKGTTISRIRRRTRNRILALGRKVGGALGRI